MSYLKTLKVDALKIDRAFIQDMLANANERTLVEAIINLAHIFKLSVIAEGVESLEHGIVLMRYGCNIAQGYGIAKPMPSHLVIPWGKSFLPHPNWALWADAKWGEQDFPVLMAGHDHISWVENILIEINSPSSTPDLNQIKTHHKCRFGQWYYSHGIKNYHHLTSFKMIEPIHEEIHRIGNTIFKYKLENDMESVGKYIKILLELKDQVLALLKELQQSIITELKIQAKPS